MNHVAASVLLPLAGTPSPSPSPVGPDANLVSPGLLGFLSFVFLIVTVFFIGRGLNKQLKRVNFPEETATASTPEPVVDAAPDASPAE